VYEKTASNMKICSINLSVEYITNNRVTKNLYLSLGLMAVTKELLMTGI
jgi:hypothetical protein